MSYILEALKKSEKERQRGTIPDLLSVQDALPQESKKRPLWPYLILIALLLNAGLLGWWLVHWQSKKQLVVAHSTVGQQHDSKGAELLSSSTAGSALKPAEQQPVIKAKPDLQRKAQDDQMPTADSRGLSVSSSTVPAESKSDNKLVPAIENKVYNLNELPISIKQSLPAFSISVFLYSEDPTSRMVKINGQMMREGQYLATGLKLEEIIPEGVILSYKDYRFRVGLK